ncbi:uncharacterized protein [Rutidosis leptorrhynchoides]|uniref:uncharacterized protein n=1 Tax=Rutidosis leptorrhynchoides TaxID=125765 RepID=UPI003A99F6F1
MIWVKVDRLTKSTQFLVARETSSLNKLAQLYVNEIVVRHGIPLSIVSDRDSKFVSNFCQSLQQNLDTCNSDLCLETGDKQYAGQEIVKQTTEKVVIAREKLEAARDVRRSAQTTGYLRGFGKRGKLAPRYIGPFNIRKVLNDQTVVLDLPAELDGIHNTFNVCYLCKFKIHDESQILPLQYLKVDMSKKLVEEPVKIVGQKITKLCHKQILMCKNDILGELARKPASAASNKLHPYGCRLYLYG